MNLATKYLGLPLNHPFMPGASPLVDNLDVAVQLEDAGAAAIVMHSLFEEQIIRQRYGYSALTRAHGDAVAEALSYFPDTSEYSLGPDRYLDRIRQLKKRVAVPVIGSLNGTTTEGWLEYSQLIEQAGADALELNFYHIATDPHDDAATVERRLLDIVAVLRESIHIPLAVKLLPFYSSLPNLAARLQMLGVDGLIVFNRVYQTDIDAEELETPPRLQLSDSTDLQLRLQWLAILSGRFRGSLAASGGVHEPIDAVKAVMAGATAVQMVSALLRHGPKELTRIRLGFEEWCHAHEYTSIDQVRGSMSLEKCPDRYAFERGSYLRTLQSWTPPPDSALQLRSTARKR